MVRFSVVYSILESITSDSGPGFSGKNSRMKSLCCMPTFMSCPIICLAMGNLAYQGNCTSLVWQCTHFFSSTCNAIIWVGLWGFMVASRLAGNGMAKFNNGKAAPPITSSTSTSNNFFFMR
ncbi:MAG: hypothetical protein BWX80_03893 [Candidatus Hydrogenedentes bacterium ADurb.Bin101]|nr:MAG: hypothetical protein BWX80_03893 [Candidatus Hydrogenedentes bacterium ADurb.Bin101]